MPSNEINLDGWSLSSPNSSWVIDDVLINKVGIRNINGLEVTSQLDLCEALSNNSQLMNSLDNMWQGAFSGVAQVVFLCYA